jgi:hypothetical protein
MLRIEPALPMLNIEPALPMLRIEPALPMDKIDPALPMLKTLPTLRMLPTLQKLRTLNKLLALARPAGRPISAPDGVRPLERMALCTATSSVFARVSLVLPNVSSLAVPSIDVNLDGVGRDNCSATTERVLPERIAELAYEAWEAARRDIFERWSEAADPRSMQPAIPKPMRDAAELLRSHAPRELAHERLHGLLDAIEAPYDTRAPSG